MTQRSANTMIVWSYYLVNFDWGKGLWIELFIHRKPKKLRDNIKKVVYIKVEKSKVKNEFEFE